MGAPRTARPNKRELMDAAGASSLEGSELLHGVIGSNGGAPPKIPALDRKDIPASTQ